MDQHALHLAIFQQLVGGFAFSFLQGCYYSSWFLRRHFILFRLLFGFIFSFKCSQGWLHFSSSKQSFSPSLRSSFVSVHFSSMYGFFTASTVFVGNGCLCSARLSKQTNKRAGDFWSIILKGPVCNGQTLRWFYGHRRIWSLWPFTTHSDPLYKSPAIGLVLAFIPLARRHGGCRW